MRAAVTLSVTRCRYSYSTGGVRCPQRQQRRQRQCVTTAWLQTEGTLLPLHRRFSTVTICLMLLLARCILIIDQLWCWIVLLPAMNLTCSTWTARVAASFFVCCWIWWCTTIRCSCLVHFSCCFDTLVSDTRSFRLFSRLASAFG